MDDESQQLLMKYLGRHLLAIAVTYYQRDDAGKLVNCLKYGCLTAFVTTVSERWYLVTAGHNIDEFWRPGTRETGKIRIVSASLADYFGITPTRLKPIPYNISDQVYLHNYNDRRDVDYCFVVIGEELKELLAANGVLPLPINELRKNYDDLEGFCILGFPEELVGPAEPNDADSLVAGIQPVHVPVQYVSLPDPPDRPPAFIADVIDMGNQSSVKGMSGGPVFGYRMGSNGLTYELLAIQSQWNGRDKRIIACPIKVALEDIRATIRAQQESDEE